MSETKVWKRVGDYTPPKGVPILVRGGTVEGPLGPVFISTEPGGLAPLSYWCELEIPTEIAPAPSINDDACRLRETFWKVEAPHSPREPWELSEAKEAWRAVAAEAQRIFGPKWRPISELDRGDSRLVLVCAPGCQAELMCADSSMGAVTEFMEIPE